MQKTIHIHRFDEESQEVVLEEDATINRALELANIQLNSSEQINSMNSASRIEPEEYPVDGETYIIVGNHVSG